MSDWKKIDNWYLRLGDWTITKSINVPLPYGLWKGEVNKGNFTTAEEAKLKYTELNK